MKDQKIVLKDGTEYSKGLASRLNNDLMVILPGNDIVGATLTFSKPEKTGTIICYTSVYKKTYTGFTALYSVQYSQVDDNTQIWLKGEDGKTSEASEYTVPEEYLPEEMRTKKEETVHE